MHALRPGPLRPKVTHEYLDIDGQQVRVLVRHGRRDQVPLLMINGIGASLEVLQPFVDAVGPGPGPLTRHPPARGRGGERGHGFGWANLARVR